MPATTAPMTIAMTTIANDDFSDGIHFFSSGRVYNKTLIICSPNIEYKEHYRQFVDNIEYIENEFLIQNLMKKNQIL